MNVTKQHLPRRPTPVDPATAPDIAAWREHVRTHAPGAHGTMVAPILADLAISDVAVVHLDAVAVRHLIQGGHVHPVGLRQLLKGFVEAGLLRAIGQPDGDYWGSYALTMPGQAAARAAVAARPAAAARETQVTVPAAAPSIGTSRQGAVPQPPAGPPPRLSRRWAVARGARAGRVGRAQGRPRVTAG